MVVAAEIDKESTRYELKSGVQRLFLDSGVHVDKFRIKRISGAVSILCITGVWK